jgi:hypothetical protein
MREATLILLSACIAALPFLVFKTQIRNEPSPQATVLWDSDLRQSGRGYAMPGITPVSVGPASR